MPKKQTNDYKKPEIEFVFICNVDIITTSIPATDDSFEGQKHDLLPSESDSFFKP